MLCRSGQLIFVLSNWMADPKCTSEIRNRWLDIWGQVCAHFLRGGNGMSLVMRTSGYMCWCVPCAAMNMHASQHLHRSYLSGYWGAQVDSGLATALKAALVGQQPLQAIKEGRIGGHPDTMGASKA